MLKNIFFLKFLVKLISKGRVQPFVYKLARLKIIPDSDRPMPLTGRLQVG